VLADGQLYGSSGRNAGDAVLVCADWRSGEIRWSEPGLGRASVALVDGHLVVLGEFGELILARATPEKYDEVSRVRLVDPAAAGQGSDSSLLVAPCWAAPIVARGYLFVRGQGRIVCLDLLTGT
jgi:outer membrane protein assembly factor BamB